jgi:hypothetical protein
MRKHAAIAIGFTTGCSLLGSTDGLSGPPADDAGVHASADGGVVDAPPPLADGEAHDATFGTAVVLSSGQLGPGAIAVNGTHVFFTNVEGATIGSVPKEGGKPTLVSVGGGGPPGDIFADPYSAVWLAANEGNEPFWSIDLTVPDSTAKSIGISPVQNATFVRGSHNSLGYFALYRSFGSWGATLYVKQSKTWTGADVGLGIPRAAVVDGLAAYVAVDSTIVVVPASAQSTVLCADQAVMDLAQDEQMLFWLTADGFVRSLAKSATGCTPVNLADNQGGLTQLTTDDANVYFTSSGVGAGSGVVSMVAKAGGLVTTLARNLNGPRGLAVDASGVYVAVHDDGNVIKIPR